MPSLNDWILRYGIILGKRFTKKQKQNFLRSAQKEFAEMGYDVDVTRSGLKIAMGTKQEYLNLYAGDFEKAKVVIVTYYDTPAKSFGCYEYEAFQQYLQRKNAILTQYFHCLFWSLAAWCCMLGTCNGLQRSGFTISLGFSRYCFSSAYCFCLQDTGTVYQIAAIWFAIPQAFWRY